jgi:hypothetical protein
MNRMNKIILCGLLLCLKGVAKVRGIASRRSAGWLATVSILMASVLVVEAADPVVSKVRVSQRPGTHKVDIRYDVADADGDALWIKVELPYNGRASESDFAPREWSAIVPAKKTPSLVLGRNVAAVHLFNTRPDSTDLFFDLTLTSSQSADADSDRLPDEWEQRVIRANLEDSVSNGRPCPTGCTNFRARATLRTSPSGMTCSSSVLFLLLREKLKLPP